MIARRLVVGCLLACVSAALLLGCSPGSNSTTATDGAEPQPPDLRILAGSELKDLEPEILAAARSVHLTVALSYAGTLEMVDRVNQGEPFEAILPPNGAYPSLALTTHKAVAKEKLFYSRVALGVKESKAHTLGWDRTPPSWSDVTQAVKAGKLVYAMTNPTTSNTGMSTLFAVAASTAGKTEDLAAAEVDHGALKDFLSGQKLTAGSSGWLADAYVRDQDRLDALVNYEAVLLRLNERPELREKLAVIYPRDGVISADYPLMLLEPQKRAAYDRLIAVLKGAGFQSNLAKAYLRPSDPAVVRSSRLSGDVVVELAFPNNLAVIDAVLAAYQAELRRPATSIYLLDISGSMHGERLAHLKAALELLTGVDARSSAARYARFQNREHVVLIPFSTQPWTPVTFAFDNALENQKTEQDLRGFVAELQARGGTAIYSALDLAFQLGHRELADDPGRLVTVVLLTDGMSNRGLGPEEFQSRWSGAGGSDSEPLRTFPILFGESGSSELETIARQTGGRSFDARHADLRGVFQEIRGYQ